MRVLSLCSGYGGIELGLENAEIAGFAENDKGASKVLKHRFPGIPNFGDLHKIDYGAVGEIDLITAGFPCQDVSVSGARAGLRAGNRTGVWYEVYRAIAELRPSLVLLENVRGLLSAGADSDVEFCPECLGSSPDALFDLDARVEVEDADAQEPEVLVLRAAGAVLGDLADLGYDAVWTTVSAADVGAPHRRERVFILAAYAGHDARAEDDQDFEAAPGDRAEAAADSGRERLRQLARGAPGQEAWPDAGDEPGDHRGAWPDRDWRAAADADEKRWHGRSFVTLRGPTLREAAWRLGERLAADANSGGGEVSSQLHGAPDTGESAPLGDDADGRAAADAAGARCEGDAGQEGDSVWGVPREPGTGSDRDAADAEFEGLERVAIGCLGPAGEPAEGGGQDWHPSYAGAIARWERILGRPAPRPAELGPMGNLRLNPAFVEFMMGLPEGWVTGVPGLSRTDQLKCLGNGVVPQQLQLALEELVKVITGHPASDLYVRPDAGPHAGVRQDSVKLLLPTPRSTDRYGPGTHGEGGMDLRTFVAGQFTEEAI